MAEGHWRKLKPTYKGTGPAGEVTYGKTWVRRRTSTKKRPKKKTTVAPVVVPKAKAPSTPSDKIYPTKKGPSRAEKDLQLWRTWKDDPTDDNLVALFTAMQGPIQKVVNAYRGSPVPPSAVEGQAQLAVLKAVKSYNPDKGAALLTHVTIHLKKVQSFVGKHQNLGRMPEHRIHRIRDYKTARTILVEKLGRAPDTQSMADFLGWSKKEVARMETELSRDDYIASKSPVPDTLPEWVQERGKVRETLRYVYYELTPDEKLVFEYTLGLYGKPQLSAGQIAKEMKISNAKVSRIKKKIDDKIRKYGGI